MFIWFELFTLDLGLLLISAEVLHENNIVLKYVLCYDLFTTYSTYIKLERAPECLLGTALND